MIKNDSFTKLGEAMADARLNTNRVRFEQEKKNQTAKKIVDEMLVSMLIDQVKQYGTNMSGYIIYPEFRYGEFLIRKKKSLFSTPSLIFAPHMPYTLESSDDAKETFHNSHDLYELFVESFKNFDTSTFNTLCEDCLILRPKILGKVLKVPLLMKF